MRRAESTHLRDGVIAIAREAAAAILAVYDSDFAVEHKDDRSPLTAADLAAHRCIVAGLARLTPDIPVLSEESADDGHRHAPAVDAVLAGRSARRHPRVRQAQRRVHRQHRADRGRRGRCSAWSSAGHRRAVARRARDRARSVATATPTSPLRARAPAAAPLRVAASRSHRDARTRGAAGRACGAAKLLGCGSSLKFCRIAEGGAGRVSALRPDQRVGHRRRRSACWRRPAARCSIRRAGRSATTSATPCSTAISSRSAIPRCPGAAGRLPA